MHYPEMMISYLALFWSFFTVDNFSHYSFSNNQEIICQWRRCYHAWLLSSIWRLLIIDPGRVSVGELDMGRLILYFNLLLLMAKLIVGRLWWTGHYIFYLCWCEAEDVFFLSLGKVYCVAPKEGSFENMGQ